LRCGVQPIKHPPGCWAICPCLEVLFQLGQYRECLLWHAREHEAHTASGDCLVGSHELDRGSFYESIGSFVQLD
jgi:hypothetical protein